MASPQHKNPCPKGHEIYIIGAAFPGHHNYMSIYLYSLSALCPGVEEKIFKIAEIFCSFYPKFKAPGGWGA